MVAGDKKKLVTINKDDATSTTSALESMLLTSTIGSEEGRDVAITDTLNVFIQTTIGHVEEKSTLRMIEKLAEIMKLQPQRYTIIISLLKKEKM